MIDKTYQPNEVEGRIYAAWESAQAFRAGRPDRKAAAPYSIVIPPPNVTGSLHLGHALNNTLQDILARFERMRGKDVLWQPGTDHAGIATQMVVERQLMERQEPGRREMGRQKFLERVWAWKAESGGTIVNQLKRLGASCDWSRERFTMDEGLSKAVLKVFVTLYNDGLIYKDKRLVNWDPKLLTAISDLEVLQVEKKGHLWHIKYPVEGTDEYIVVATTRPETMLGDTAVAVHPDNERLKHLIGKTAVLPLVGRRIPIVGDDYADPEKGTGAVKITPAHDFNDFEVGRRHNLPQISVLDVEGRMALKDNEAFLDGVPSTPALDETTKLDGLDRYDARKRILALAEAEGAPDREAAELLRQAVDRGIADLDGIARIFRALLRIAEAEAGARASRGHFTATVGEFSIEPSAANVIPNRARLLIDARSADRAAMEDFVTWVETRAGRLPEGISGAVRLVSDNHPTRTDAGLLDKLAAAADLVGRAAASAKHAWDSAFKRIPGR